MGPRRTLTGEPLEPVLACTALAQAHGLINREHVKVVRETMANIPAAVDVLTRSQIEADLARTAISVGPKELKDNADRTLFLLDQDGPEPDETERERRRGLWKGPQGRDKVIPIKANLTPEAWATWEPILAKWAAPGMCNPADEHPCYVGTPTQAQIDNDHRTLAQRQHDALVAVGRSVLASGELGQHNGLPTTIIVRTTLQDLERRAGVGVTGGGTVMPISDVIAMAAHATHYLAVFDKATGSALDLFRARRAASAAQRIMLIARDGGCTKPGCTVPAYGSQVHHAARDWAARRADQHRRTRSGVPTGQPDGRTRRLDHPHQRRHRRRMDPTATPGHRPSPRQQLPPTRTTLPTTRRRTDRRPTRPTRRAKTQRCLDLL